MKQPLTILPLLRAEKDGAEIFVNLPLRALSCERKQKKSAARSFLKQHQNDAVDNACKRAEDNDRPCDDEHFCRHAGDEALWLCQDRHTVFSEFFQLPSKWGALIVLACRYKFKPARSTHIYLNLS